MGQHDRALIYFDNGIKAAQEANDRALGAYLLGSVTTLPAFREHSPQATLHVLREETRGFRASDATPTTRAWLASLDAEASAMLGDASGALGALERSEAAIEASEEADRVRPLVSSQDLPPSTFGRGDRAGLPDGRRSIAHRHQDQDGTELAAGV